MIDRIIILCLLLTLIFLLKRQSYCEICGLRTQWLMFKFINWVLNIGNQIIMDKNDKKFCEFLFEHMVSLAWTYKLVTLIQLRFVICAVQTGTKYFQIRRLWVRHSKINWVSKELAFLSPNFFSPLVNELF